ncbi:alpha-galactosidase [Phaeodactylibacter xiamenensis]|uniref:alpha-galactosidase n=1 Tax=Phaeodactylibacter xiamenensis TaxID=1524460 RepID=UPI0024A84EDE|nr:alpha-galactosidase [Phaeodactylibacter xiamenensis]
MKNTLLQLGLALLLLQSCAPKEPTVLQFENEALRKTFSQPRHPDAISVELYDKQQEVFLNNPAGLPYFEAVINGQILSAADPVWVFESQQSRSMGNGGTEYELRYRAATGPAEGLVVLIRQQLFPGSPIVREKLELLADAENRFNLNKKDGELHFRFPQYRLRTAQAGKPQTTEIRIATWNHKPITFAKAGDPPGKSNHMYYPDVRAAAPDAPGDRPAKGPFRIIHNNDWSFGLAYEHASQDNTNGLLDIKKKAEDGRIVDAMQGIKGVFNFEIKDEDFQFLGIGAVAQAQGIDASVQAMRGAYLDGEPIDARHPYASVWTAHFHHTGPALEDSKALIRDYLLNKICEHPASRKPEFYYNTWGMQRASEELRGVLTYENLFREIEHAADLGADIFVLDDGWEEKHGDWTPHRERLSQGLGPIREKLEQHGLKMGIWLSPPTIDSTTERYHAHPEWVVKDSEGNPIAAQWGHCGFDMVSGFQQVFIEDCKRLIDQGARFFKWDAINTFFSDLPGLHHGDSTYTASERRARYEYLLPIYVTEAMRILTEYEPELIIEVDLTEARRVMTGLAPLSQGKLFWMNNGASGYNDYGPYRAQSMRTIPNEFAGIIPLELFTYANYPHDLEGSLDYNIHTSLIAGHGYWGKLDLTTADVRQKVGAKTKLSKQVLPYLTDIAPEVEGKVGASPEVYRMINAEAGAGQVFAFTTEPVAALNQKVKVNTENVGAILHTPFELSEQEARLQFTLDQPYASGAAFLLPIGEKGIQITASDSPLLSWEVEAAGVAYHTAGDGVQTIRWPEELGSPTVTGAVVLEKTKNSTHLLFKLESKSGDKVKIKAPN